jgi:hypothetical protein
MFDFAIFDLEIFSFAGLKQVVKSRYLKISDLYLPAGRRSLIGYVAAKNATKFQTS